MQIYVLRNRAPVSWPVFSYKSRYNVGFGLVEMAISTNPKPTIYRNVYENSIIYTKNERMSFDRISIYNTNSI